MTTHCVTRRRNVVHVIGDRGRRTKTFRRDIWLIIQMGLNDFGGLFHPEDCL